MNNTIVRYRMDKVRGQPEKREVYFYDGIIRRIELSPNYCLGPCPQDIAKKIYSDCNFKQVAIPSDLLEGIIKDIEALKKIDAIFDQNHDASVLPRIEKSAQKIRMLAGQQLGYPYAKYRPKKRQE